MAEDDRQHDSELQKKPAPIRQSQGGLRRAPQERAFPITRRRLLKLGAGAGIAAVLLDSPRAVTGRAFARESIAIPGSPNIIVLMTDQERHHMHWPAGWAEKNLPGLQRLKRNGLYFNRAYTAVCQCSPSRALMMTGRFAPVNRVTRTFLWPGLVHKNRQPNIASLLKEKTGYEVVWKGKWHLSWPSNAAPGKGADDWTTADISAMERNYGWSGWNPPDAGNAIYGWSGWNPPDAGNAIERWQPSQFGKYDGIATLGGGAPDNDGRYVTGPNGKGGQTPGFGESVVDFLKNRAPKLGKPFCLFVSLVNPHDVYVYPHFWKMAGYQYEKFARLGIDLPPNYDDDLLKKPNVQRASRAAYEKFAALDTPQKRREYVNFYAHLNKLADGHVMTVLDTLEETRLLDNTIILRIADHGEGGLSHGMREKAYTVYEEMIHIPLIVHNRRLYPEPLETDAFYDHLDLMPTILDLAGVPNPQSYALGESIVPVIRNPKTGVQDHTIFSFDDLFFLPAGIPGGHIRAIREGDWTYAIYFGLDGSGIQYELYNIKNDPGQMNNLLYGEPPADVRKEWSRLHGKLTRRFIETANLPDSFAWPIEPARA
jgi:arylsulfatase A-like enzyme